VFSPKQHRARSPPSACEANNGNRPRPRRRGAARATAHLEPPEMEDRLQIPDTSAAKEHTLLLIPLVFQAIPTWSTLSAEQLA